MNKESRATYIQAQIAQATIEAMGMQADNKQREALGQSMAFVYEDFIGLVETYGIGHNDVIGYLRDDGIVGFTK